MIIHYYILLFIRVLSDLGPLRRVDLDERRRGVELARDPVARRVDGVEELDEADTPGAKNDPKAGLANLNHTANFSGVRPRLYRRRFLQLNSKWY